MIKKIILFTYIIHVINASEQDHKHVLDGVIQLKSVQKIIMYYLGDDEEWLASIASDLKAHNYDLEYIQKRTAELSTGELKALRNQILSDNLELFTKYISESSMLALGAKIKALDLTTSSAVQRVSTCPDRKLVAFSTHNKEFELYQLDLEPKISYKQKILYRCQVPVSALAFNKDGLNLLLGYTSGIVQRYDITNSGNPIFAGGIVCGGVQDRIRQITCSQNNKYALIGIDNKTAVLVDLTIPFQLNTAAVLQHNDSVNGVGFSPDCNYCVTGSENKFIAIWDIHNIRDIRKISEIQAHEGAVNAIAIMKTKPILLTGSDDVTAKLWDMKDPQNVLEIFTLKGHTAPITCIRFSPCENLALTSSKDGTVRIWDIKDFDGIFTLNILDGQKNAIFEADFGPNLEYIVAGAWENCVIFWFLQYHYSQFWNYLSYDQMSLMVKLFKSTDDQILTEDRVKKNFEKLPENLQRYLRKIYVLRSQFPNELVELIRAYVGESFAYNYQPTINVPQSSGSSCVIS